MSCLNKNVCKEPIYYYNNILQVHNALIFQYNYAEQTMNSNGVKSKNRRMGCTHSSTGTRGKRRNLPYL